MAGVFAVQIASAQSPEKAPLRVLQRMAAGQSQDLIVVFDNKEILREASVMQSTALPSETSQSIEYKAARYSEKKREIMSSFTPDEAEELKHYSHLPMSVVRIHSRQALDRLLAHPGVLKVFEDRVEHRMLTESLPLIGQPQAAANGDIGTGTTVAVIDTGVDYTLPAFGSCTAPGVPAGCKVVFFQHFESNPVSLDPNGHGTNVAGIVVGVAPGAHIAALDVFNNATGTALSSDIINAGNWAIANKSTYNIVAMNLSLGSGQYTSPETNGIYNTLVASARAAGILTIAAAGNEGYTNALSSPAATQGVVSVGAVYDSAFGTISFPSIPCTDISAADKVTCFSNSASFLTLLAPGSQITAAGLTMNGTSQASPHVAGAVAVLRAAFPSETLDQTVARLTNGVQVTDSRNSIVKPRLSLPLAIGLAVPCTYVISPTSVSYNAASATGSITITASAGCAWTAVSNVGWASVSSGASGTGNGKVTYSLTSNTGASARSGTITIAGLSFAVTQAGSGTFPVAGLMPAGWTTTAGANAGWSVASDTAFEGIYSLKSNPIGNNQKAQIEVTGSFTAGNVNFALKVSSELNFDFLRFYVDGVMQGQWSGEQAWTMSSFPLTAGAHTLRWSYEKDGSVSSGSDAAWIDAVSLPAGLPVYAYNIPSPSNPDQPFIRIYNTSTSVGAVRMTLYDQNGNILGNANSLLIASIPANSVTVFTASDIAAAVNVSDWAGRAWMIVQPDISSLRIENLIRSSLLINMSCLESQYAYYLPSPGNSEQPYVRLYNTSSSAGAIRGTLYDESGNVLGTPNATLVTSLVPNAVMVLSSSDIASAFGVSSWTGRAWMRLSSDFTGMKIMNTLRDLTANTLTDVSCDSGSTGTSADAYNIPPPGSATAATLRIYNTSSSPSTVKATLYNENGSVLGSANAMLGTAAANSVLVLSQSNIASLVGANSWTGRAWMQINSSVTGMKVLGFTKTAMLMDMSCVEGSYAFNIPDASNPTDQPIIRLYNTSASSGNLYGTLYDVNGNVLGKANTTLFPNMPAKSMTTFSAATLASAVGTLPWTARSWMKLTSDFSGLKVLNILQDMASGNWSNMSCSTN